MRRNFYRDAWAHEVITHSNLSKKEAYEYVDNQMEEYYQNYVMEETNESN